MFVDQLTPPQSDAVEAPAIAQDAIGLDAEEIRTAWIDGMRLLESRLLGCASTYGVDGLGRWDRRQIWRQIAHRCSARGITPLRLIRFVLSRWTTPRLPPPSILIRAETLRAFELQPRPTSRDFEIEFRIQQNAAVRQLYRLRRYNMGLNERQLYFYTLVNHQVSMSALFRYCLAHQVGISELVERFFPAAVAQYSLDHELYDRVGAT